jgi:hypothetical protein
LNASYELRLHSDSDLKFDTKTPAPGCYGAGSKIGLLGRARFVGGTALR